MSIYERLFGLEPMINAAGWGTEYGGSLMHPEVITAMVEASREWVDLRELLKRAGEAVAKICRAEAAFITSGASAGIAITAAACMTGTAPEKIQRLPDSEGMKNEFIMQKGQVVAYTHSVEVVGGKIVEVGGTPILKRLGTQVRVLGNTAEYVEGAISERTAALFVTLSYRCVNIGMVPLEEIVNIGKKKNIPVILDAADELPPRKNLENFIQMGVDLVIFSGGKGIEGPNNTGFILGRKDLIQACAMHSNPNREGIGRGYKVSKEDVVGLVIALQRFMEEDSEKKVQNWIARAKRIGDALTHCPGVESRVVYPTETGKQIPYVRLTLDEQELGIKTSEIVQQLKERNPPIMVFAPYADIGIINIEVQTLRDGEEEILIRRLAETLKKKVK